MDALTGLRFLDGALPWPTALEASLDGGVVLRRGSKPFPLRAGQHGALAADVAGAGAWVRDATSAGATPWIEVSHPRQMHDLPDGAGLLLRPDEVGGPSGGIGFVVLLQAANATGRPWLASGLGAGATGAALAAGATGAVCNAALWATDASPLAPALRDRVAGARSGRDTERIEAPDGSVRVLTRGNPMALRALRRSEDPASLLAADWWIHEQAVVPAPAAVREARDGRGLDAATAWRRWWARVESRRDGPETVAAEVVQGPMANVSEGTAFARAVAGAGALPFLALGALRPEVARERMAAWSGALGRFGVGVIGFDAMPHRDAHLEAVVALGPAGPCAVTLAGATPEFAARLVVRGLPVWLHTPSSHLLRSALDVGIQTVVCEGHEAGGHVGAQPSSDLWEEAVEAAAGAPVRLVLAGGLADAASGRFARALAAPVVAGGGRLALQVGTALLLTHEALETGALTPTYAQMALAAHQTTLVGATVDLPLRVVANAWSSTARAEERRMRDAGQPLQERRAQLERNNLGRTRIAAKGIERDPNGTPDRPYRLVEPVRVGSQGAHSVGQSVAVIHDLRRVEEVVRAMAGHRPFRRPRVVPSRLPATARPSQVVPSTADGIAIVGLGCVLPDAPDVPSFWDLLVGGRDAIRPVPEARWASARYFDADANPDGPARSYARLAGTVDHDGFDPLRFRIPPRVVPALDPSQRLALRAAAEAVADAGWDRPGAVDPKRAMVVFGNAMGGEFAKDLAVRVRFREVISALVEEGLVADGARDDVEARVEARLSTRLPPVSADSMAGLLANVVAGRVAAWLDWQGGNLVVDAACAASLGALSVAVDALRARRVDAVLCGGVDTDLSAETFVGFSRTEALARGKARPFSSLADGFVMGEGCAVLALMRHEDAVRAGRPVWALLRGVGQSSDGRGAGITAPTAEGQALAIERAWADAGLDPRSVGVIEAHGTGTALGDRVEAGVLADLLTGVVGDVWLGSVKSNIGHLKGAAGAASLVKAALMLATGIVPPTLHAGPIRPLGDGPLRLPRHPVALERPLAGVSAFGFGGTNWHAALEASSNDPPARADALRRRGAAVAVDRGVASWGATPATVLLVFAADDEDGLADAVRARRTTTPQDAVVRAHRLVAVGSDAAERAVAALDGPVPGVWRGNVARRPLFVLAPGQGAQRPGGWASLRRLPPSAAALAGRHEPSGDDPVAIHLHLVGAALGAAALLGPVDGAFGHSVGEIGALVLAGRLGVDDAWALAEARGRAFEATPPGAMVAVPPGAVADALCDDSLTIAVLAPQHVVLAGSQEAVDRLCARRADARRLAVRRAYHSPAVAGAVAPLQRALSGCRFGPGAPVWSGATARPMVDPTADLLAAVLAPVRKSDALAAARAALPDAILVEIGPGQSQRGDAPEVVSLDPTPGVLDGVVFAAAALLAAGRDHLLDRLPATVVAVAPPASATVHRVAAVASVRPSTPSGSDAGVVGALRALVCEITGYPEAFVQDDAELGADLGIDSIRRMELLGTVEQRLGVRATEADHGRLATANLRDLAAWIEERRAAPSPEAVAPTTPGLYVRIDVAVAERDVDGDVLVVSPGRTPADVLGALPATPPPGVEVQTGDAGGAAAVGFLRCLAQELGTSLRVVERDADASNATSTGAHLRRTARGPRQRAWTSLRSEVPALPTDLVVVATGNPDGITGVCVNALRPWSPRVLWLGRRAPSDGSAFRAVDLADAGAVAAAIADWRSTTGPPALVVHGAGALADGPAATRTDTQRSAVLAPKWQGARALAEATRDDPLVRFVTLSSLVAHVGNPGQTLYAAANAAMETVLHERAPTVHIAFTAWSERGMAARSGALPGLRARGLTALRDAQGAALFLAALGATGTVLATADPPPGNVSPPWPLSAAVPGGYALELSPRDPALADHRVAGRPLVPAALWITALRHLADGDGLADLHIDAPVFVDAARTDVRVLCAQDRMWVEAGGVIVARARRVARPVGGTEAAPLALATAPPYGDGLLFHGSAWQVLAAVGVDATTARLRPTTVDPLAGAIDGVHQLAALWAARHTGALCLPVGADEWRWTSGPAPIATAVRIRPQAGGDAVRCDATLWNEAGTQVASATGIRLAAAGAVRAAV